MPRKREGTVKESLEELRELEEHYRGKPEEVRVTVLRLLKEDDERGIEDVAMLVGYSKPTVKRWWRTYREGGVKALIDIAVASRKGSTIDEDLHTLKQKLQAGDFTKIEDVRNWLETYGTGHKGSSIRTSNKHNGKSGHVEKVSSTPDQGRNVEDGVSSDVPAVHTDNLIRFLSTLPTSHSIQEWTDQFRHGLQALLGDVDRISLSINIQCELFNPEGYSPTISIAQSLTTGARAADALNQDTSEHGGEYLKRFLEYLKRRKFPFAEFHAPRSFEYYHMGQAYIGVIVLWRDRSRPPISDRTLQLMERLQNFVVFLMSDFVARHQLARPIERVFNRALEGLMREIGLTSQEQRIMILQLLGLSYEEVASELNISLNTVRFHLRSVYNKTGTHSQAELFAKYFTPRIDPD